jgi:hypothetical protein
VRFDEASLGRFEPKTNPTRGKAREKSNRHPNGEVLLDNADAVIDALPAFHLVMVVDSLAWLKSVCAHGQATEGSAQCSQTSLAFPEEEPQRRANCAHLCATG